MMSDRRRVNGPVGATSPPAYYGKEAFLPGPRRGNVEARQFYLRTGVTPSASGSAYFETQQDVSAGGSGIKLCCTVHGPRSLPRSAPFSPHMVLSTHVKYAPFATRRRKSYLKDAGERDLSIHLETALRGAIIADRWPKSGVDVIVTVIEGDMPRQKVLDEDLETWEMMTVLSGCITVASAAIADAGIDCVDTVVGGVAAFVSDVSDERESAVIIDPIISDHQTVLAVCCVAYLPTRDEITSLWLKGCLPPSDVTARQSLIGSAITASKCAAKAVGSALVESLSST